MGYAYIPIDFGCLFVLGFSRIVVSGIMESMME